jgi:methyl-accepting chemotaxis protein
MPKETTAVIPAPRSIRVRVLAASLVLALSGAVFGIINLLGALADRREAQALSAASETLASLSRATISLSLERSLSQVAIELPGVVDPAIRRMLDQQRAVADAGLQQALTQAARLTTSSESSAFGDGIVDLRRRLDELRMAFDRAITVPLAARDRTAVAGLPKQFKALVIKFQSTGHLLRGPGFQLPTDVSILETLRDRAWVVREFGGRDRTYLAIAVATGGPISEVRREEMAELGLRADDAWADIVTLLRHPGLPQGVRDAAAALGEGYFGSYDRLRRRMLEAARQPQPRYPVDFGTFFRDSSAALAEAERLSTTASEAITKIWSATSESSLRAVIANVAVMLLVLLAAALSAMLILGAFRRLNRLRSGMERLAAGELGLTVPDAAAGDEVGAMARAVLVFRDTAEARRALERAAAAERAEKDLRQTSMERHVHDFTESLAKVMRGLTDAAERMELASDSMAEAAERTGGLARSTTGDAQDSARSLVAVASATEELAASVAAVSRQVASAATTAQASARHADGTEQTMAGLSQAAGRIDAVARLIADIAGQTNLLALNATIEAARAGEAGKGFAVVASEVKHLAGRTASATEEIGEQIGAIQRATAGAVAAVRQLALEVREMESKAAIIAAAIDQQGGAVREIASSIAAVSTATDSAVHAMGDAAAAAEEAYRVSAEVRDAAGHVGREAATLGSEVEGFMQVMLNNGATEPGSGAAMGRAA